MKAPLMRCYHSLALALLISTAPSALATAPTEIIPGRLVGRSIVSNPDGSWTHIRVRNVGGQFVLSERDSADNGQSWTSYTNVAILPDNSFGTALSAGIDSQGEVQLFMVRKRGTWGPPATGTETEDRFLDYYQMRTVNGRSQWEAPQLIREGYVGQLMAPTTLADGRILSPFFSFEVPRAGSGPNGAAFSTAAYSDDHGATWNISNSQLTTPSPTDFNGSRDGAVEPIIIDQSRFGDPNLNQQKMLIRTQDGYLYESISTDRGETWSNAAPSAFPSSNSAATYEWLPDRDGDGDEELILFWNNTRIIPRFEGQGVYSGRDAIHAAISGDGGATWDGYREVHLDPSRHVSPPMTGDRGTANPFTLAMNNDDRIALLTGNGPGAATIFYNPDDLFETSFSSDFTDGYDGWSAFTHVGPASGFFRDRVIGTEIVDDSTASGGKALHLNNPDGRPDGMDGDGAVYNFTKGDTGRIDIRMKITGDTKVADIQLTDRFLDPTDDTSLDVAVFNVRFNSRGELVGDSSIKLTADTWHDVSIDWDLDLEQATLWIDGVEVKTLSMLYDTPTGGISYLRLRSPFVSALDPEGWRVDSVSVVVPEPTAAVTMMLLSLSLGIARRPRINTR